MDKSRLKLPDLHPAVQKLLIISMGQEKGVLLIRDMGHDDHHLHPSLCREYQGVKGLVVQNQVRRHDMHIFFCLIQHIHVHVFAHRLVVQRGIAVGDHVTLPAGSRFRRCLFVPQIPLIGNRRPVPDIPHLQEHGRKALHPVPFQHHRRVLPVSEPFSFINIFIRQVHPACKSRVTVNDHDLSVIPVIVDCGQHRLYGRKRVAMDTLFLHLPGIPVGQQHEGTHSVVHKPDLHPLLCLLLQDLQDGIPHDPPLHNKILQKNVLLSLAQFFLKPLKFLLPAGKIGDAGVAVHRKPAPVGDIIRDPSCQRLLL